MSVEQRDGIITNTITSSKYYALSNQKTKFISFFITENRENSVERGWEHIGNREQKAM